MVRRRVHFKSFVGRHFDFKDGIRRWQKYSRIALWLQSWSFRYCTTTYGSRENNLQASNFRRHPFCFKMTDSIRNSFPEFSLCRQTKRRNKTDVILKFVIFQKKALTYGFLFRIWHIFMVQLSLKWQIPKI